MIGISALGVVWQGDDAHGFKAAIRSVFDQVYENYEVILVVNGELCEEKEKCIDFYGNDEKLRVVRLPENKGLARALNIGLNLCTFDLVMRFDADDINSDLRMQTQAQFLIENGDISVLGCQLSLKSKHGLALKNYPCSHDRILKFFWLKNTIPHPGVMFRKCDILEVGGYPEFNRAQDYALWGQIVANGKKLANHKDCLVQMNVSNGFSTRRGVGYFINEVSVLKYLLNLGVISRSQFLVSVVTRLLLRSGYSLLSIAMMWKKNETVRW